MTYGIENNVLGSPFSLLISVILLLGIINFGNYFQRCNKNSESALWGNYRPVPDTCNIKPHTGTPCHSIWNNLTKRRSVVDYKREPTLNYKPLNKKF